MDQREINGSVYTPSVLGEARRIEWEAEFPTDLRPIVEDVFAPLEFILPTWCQTLVIRYVPDLDSTLTVEMSVRNRWTLLRIGSDWFRHPRPERESSLIHEFCHVFLEPYQWNIARALDAYGPEDDTPERKFLDQMRTDGMEQAVEDMARAIQKALRRLTLDRTVGP